MKRLMPLGGTSPVVRLKPGELFFDPKPHRLSTLLGSCVAVCLWDERLHMGGMTHSLVPTGGAGEMIATDSSIRELVQRMMRSGCRAETLQAKLFGGCAPLKNLGVEAGIGAANIERAVEVLGELGIRIVAQEILGEGGIMIHQDTGTGEVSGRMISPLRRAEDP